MPMTLEEQINSMLNFGSSQDGGSDDKGDSSPKHDEPNPADDKPRESSDDKDEKTKNANGHKDGEKEDEKVETPVGDEPSDDEPADDSDDDDDDLAAMKKENEYLRSKLEEVLKTPKGEEPTPADPLANVANYDPIGDTDVDEIIADADSFKKWATNAFGKFQSHVLDTLKSALPSLIDSRANQVVNSYDKAREFYEANSDLKQYKSFVGQKFKEVYQENKDKSMEEVLQLAADKARKELKLDKPKQDKKAREKAKNSLPKRGASASARSKGADTLEGVEGEIADMLSAIDQ